MFAFRILKICGANIYFYLYSSCETDICVIKISIIHCFHHNYCIQMREVWFQKQSLLKRYMQVEIRIKNSRRSKNKYFVSLILVTLLVHLNHDSLGKKLFTLENRVGN